VKRIALLLSAALLASCATPPPVEKNAKKETPSAETPPKPKPEPKPVAKAEAPAAAEPAPERDPRAAAVEVAPEPEAAPKPEPASEPEVETLPQDGIPPGWRFGVQAYTFRRFTFFQTVEKLAALGVRYVEMYPGQKIGGDVPGRTGHGIAASSRAAIREKLAKHGMRISAYGVVNALGEDGWRKIFEFARDMDIDTINIEPPQHQLAIVSKLCDEYGVKAGIHNHAKPSRYWDPRTVAAALQGTSELLGACPDVGHWTRSGLRTVDGLNVLSGRIVSMHLKDVKSGAYVALGEGDSSIAAVMAELRRQKFAGAVSLEHEGHVEDPFMPVKHSVLFVRANATLDLEKLDQGAARPGDQTDDVADVWTGLDPHADGLWGDAPGEAKDDVAAGYVDITDSIKGVVTGPDEGYPNEHYTCAFDNTSQTKYCVNLASVWVQYAFPEGQRHAITAYSIRTANDAPERDPSHWKLLGSDDEKDFEVVDERDKQKFRGRFQKRVFEVSKPKAFRIYRLDIVRNASAGPKTQLSEIELLVKKEDAPPGVLPPEVAVPLKEHPDSSKWQDLFASDLAGALGGKDVWSFDGGVLTASQDKCLFSAASYDNFIVDLEFKTADGTNSGVIAYCSDVGNWIPNSIEIQIADDHSKKWSGGHPNTKCCAFYGHKGASGARVKKPGEWNRLTVQCKDHMIWVMLNGAQVNEMDMRRFTDAKKNPDGSTVPSWLSKPVASLPRRGHIGLQGKHAGAPIYFRNLKIMAIR